MIWASSAPGGGAGGWGISVVIRVSLYEFRSVGDCQCFGFPAALGEGADECGGIWGMGDAP